MRLFRRTPLPSSADSPKEESESLLPSDAPSRTPAFPSVAQGFALFAVIVIATLVTTLSTSFSLSVDLEPPPASEWSPHVQHGDAPVMPLHEDAVHRAASPDLPVREEALQSLPEFCRNQSRRAERPGIAPGVPVQYVHIPKAGGTTLQEEMMEWAHSHGVKILLHDGDHEGVWRCSDVQRGLLLGHRGFGYCQRMERTYGERAFYLVAMREPIARFRSLFDYIMANNFWFFRDYHRHWNGRQLSDLVIEYNTTLSLGLPPKHPKMWGPLRFWSLARQQSGFMCGWDCVSMEHNYTSHQVAERAIANLMRTDAVVVMEKLDDLIDQLRFHLTWIPAGVRHFPYENKHSGRKSVLNAQATQIVTEWSRIDIELYQLAKERAEQLTGIARLCLNVTST
jgi:hypothetical protein